MTNVIGAFCALIALSCTSDLSVRAAGIKEYEIFMTDEFAIVAVIPESEFSFERKKKTLDSAAKIFAEALSKSVFLTEDMVLFSAITRYEARKNPSDKSYILERIEKIKAQCYTALI